MSRVCLYYRAEPETDRWVSGDRYIRPAVRRLLRGRPRPSGIDKVFINLCLGLDRLGIPYLVNLPFQDLKQSDLVGVLGRGRHVLKGYDRNIPIVAGIGLMTHPSEWPDICEQYPVARYLQHSNWANDVYKPYFGDKCRTWPVGIDTQKWTPLGREKDIDILLYDKVHWNRELYNATLIDPIRESLRKRKLTYRELRYGNYAEADFRHLLSRSKAMIFLAEHESQGIACLECLASGVPILAWDQGFMLDPSRFKWGTPIVPATSVPFFDSRCGEKFQRIEQFEFQLETIQARLSERQLCPRDYIMENLTVERCSREFLSIMAGANGSASEEVG